MKLEDEIVQSKFRNEYQKGFLNIIYTGNWLQHLSEKYFSGKGITSQQFNVLRILRGQHPKPASVNLLKERMLDKMSDASRLVERLRLKGLVTREDCPGDRRRVEVLITQKGLSLLKEMDVLDLQADELLKNLSNSEIKKLNDLLDKLRG